MKFIKREPGIGYMDTWLWLPKSHISEEQIESSLVYLGRDMERIEAWHEEPHHYRVPRNYFRGIRDLSVLPFPVKDCVFRDFPQVKFRSSVTLDRNPAQTFQRESSKALLSSYDCILCLRCGAGKTVIALHSAAQLGGPILVIVQNKGLAKQWAEEIEMVLGIPEHEVGRLGGDGSPFDWKGKKICIAIVNTLALRARNNSIPFEMGRYFKVIIGDETHTLGSPFFNLAIPPFFGRRWGLSATPTREDGFDSLLRYTMGEVVYSYLMPELVPTVIFKILPTQLRLNNKDIRKATHDIGNHLHYGKLYDYFGSENPDKRMDLIADEVKKAVKQGRQCLVITHSRSTIAALMERIPGAGEVHGGVASEIERLHTIRTKNPVIAIMQHGKQALNKPELDTLFVCDPFRKEGVLQQVMGRVQRNFAGKKGALVLFFEDRQIKACFKLCQKLRKSLNRWPKYKGGRIPFIVKK